MSALGTALATAGGVALVALALRDIFDALFHPEGRGTMARGVVRGLWVLTRPLRARSANLSAAVGPLGLIAVVSLWVALLTVGWALIFWPHLADHFQDAGGEGFVDAVNVSLITLTTLGFNGVPTADWLKVVAPLEALIGFGLLSASISWLLLLYPVLARRRSLSYDVWLLRQAQEEVHAPVGGLSPDAAERLYAELTSRLVTVERDFVNFPIAYYFSESDPRFSLPVVAPFLVQLADAGLRDDAPPDVRLRAGMLRDALDDLGETLSRRFLGPQESLEDALAAYRRDHLRD